MINLRFLMKYRVSDVLYWFRIYYLHRTRNQILKVSLGMDLILPIKFLRVPSSFKLERTINYGHYIISSVRQPI